MDRLTLTDDQSRAVKALAAAGMPVAQIAAVLMVPEDFITGNCPEWRVGRIERLRVEQLEAALLPPETKYRDPAEKRAFLARPIRKRAFLAALEVNGGSITDAALAAGIERQLHYRWLEDDPEYRAEFDAAKTRAADVLEDEAVRRARIGVLEPMYNRAGELVGHKLRFSDQLLLARLAADRPDRWRARVSAELTGKNGGAIETKSALPEWLLEHLKSNIHQPGDTSPSPASGSSTRT